MSDPITTTIDPRCKEAHERMGAAFAHMHADIKALTKAQHEAGQSFPLVAWASSGSMTASRLAAARSSMASTIRSWTCSPTSACRHRSTPSKSPSPWPAVSTSRSNRRRKTKK